MASSRFVREYDHRSSKYPDEVVLNTKELDDHGSERWLQDTGRDERACTQVVIYEKGNDAQVDDEACLTGINRKMYRPMILRTSAEKSLKKPKNLDTSFRLFPIDHSLLPATKQPSFARDNRWHTPIRYSWRRVRRSATPASPTASATSCW